MYYLGIMQAIIRVIGRFLAFCMDTTAAESINAGANIFVSMVNGLYILSKILFSTDVTRNVSYMLAFCLESYI